MDPTDPPPKTLVAITLPPPDNPSLGKTITVYQVHGTHHHQSQQTPLPVHLPSTHPRQSSLSRFRLGPTKTRVLTFLGIILLALTLSYSLYPQELRELFKFWDEDDDGDDRGPRSFVLPLHSKSWAVGNTSGEIEMKLGRFVEGGGSRSGAYEDQKVGSAASRVDSSTILPVRGNVYPEGLYFTSLLLGNPPRPYFLDMDTGSDLTWIQCDAPCMSCAKGPHRLYKPSRSKILAPNDLLCTEVQRNLKTTYCDTCQQCDYQIEYADHSSSVGVLAKDELNLMFWNGSLAKLDIIFGCAYDQRGSLLNSLVKTDGILGLSKAKVSLPSQLASQGIINNVFGHCLTAYASGGGYMFLGEELVPDSSMAWVPMFMSPIKNSYTAEFVSVSYGSWQMKLDVPDGMRRWVLFDSGSSYTYFPREAYLDLLFWLQDVSAGGLIRETSDPTLPLCWRSEFPIRSVADVKHLFKPLVLKFRSSWLFLSSKFIVSPEGFLVLSKSGNICLGILDGSEVLGGSSIILGDISMRGHLIVYDNMKERIGWVKSDCTTPTRFKSLPAVTSNDLSA